MHTALGNRLAVASEGVALIDMLCQERRMVALAVGNFHDLVVDIGNLVVVPKCTFASDYVDK